MKWRKSVHRNSRLPIREDDCSYVWLIPIEDRCEWVKNTEDCNLDSYIQYAELLFCTFSTDNSVWFSLGLFFYILWLLYLFFTLAVTADNFFCPSLSVIAAILRLSENIAGVTILAFGNGAPDIFTSLVADEADEELIMFTELIGAGIFVTTIIAGSVAIFSPFRVLSKPFMRDCCFYAFAVSWIAYITGDHIIHLWESLSVIFIYILFIVTVVSMQYCDSSAAKKKAKNQKIGNPQLTHTFNITEEADVDPRTLTSLKLGAYRVEAKLDVAIATEEARTQSRHVSTAVDEGNATSSRLDTNRPQGLFKEFLYDINPINVDEWRTSSIFVRIIMVARVPVMMLLQLFVPVVNETAVKRGWSKLLNCVQLCLTPIVATVILEVHRETFGQVPVLAIVAGFSILTGIIVFTTTNQKYPPKYHESFAFLGFLGAMLVVWVIANEVMSVLQCIGFASGISDAMLGITLLAWGNSIGDLISNVAIARRGYPRMGYSACFGGPMFNTLLGLGLTWSIAAARQPDYRTLIRTSDMMDGCLAFLLCSLASSIIYLNIMGFLARRSYGFLLYSIYFIFIFINFLSEIHVIHPLGTDHRED